VVDDTDQSDDTRAIRAFNDAVAADPRVVCVQTTVRDGVTLIRKLPVASGGG
jgi:predicted O-methyltransferase YrrM